MACVGIALASPVASQDIVQDIPSGGGVSGLVGQSFTATVTGTVTQISVSTLLAGPTTLALYDNVGTGQLNGLGTPLYTQAFALTGSGGAGFETFVLTTPFPVVAGNTYSFAFTDASLFSVGGDPYPGGTAFVAGTTVVAADLRFIVRQVAAPVVPISDWLLLIVGLSLAGGAALHLQRRRLAA